MVRVVYEKGSGSGARKNDGGAAIHGVPRGLPSDAAVFAFDVYFEKGFQFSSGGKMCGFSIGNGPSSGLRHSPTAGCVRRVDAGGGPCSRRRGRAAVYLRPLPGSDGSTRFRARPRPGTMTSATEIIPWTKFDPNKIVFSPTPGINQNNKGSFVQLSYPGTGKDRGFKLLTPELTLPFGVSLYDTKGQNTAYDGPEAIANYGFDMSFAGHESVPSVARFLALMREFDEVLLNTAVANSKAWFGGRVLDKTTLKDLFYRPMIKDSTHPEKNYPPVMKTKTKAREDGSCMVAIFNPDRSRASVGDIQKGTKVKFLLNVDRVWFTGMQKMFGITWRPDQIMICAKPPPRDMCSFMDEDEPEAQLE